MDNFLEFEKKRKYHIERTKSHIERVQKYAKLIEESFPEFKGLYDLTLSHDESKFKSPELLPYIEINWFYKLKSEGIEYKLPENSNDATFHHIKNNSHHPEYHDPNVNINCLNLNNRDAVGEYMVDATKMPRIDIAHMCSDWMAMSEERGGIPQDWARSVINKRFKFTDEQTMVIYEILNTIWIKK